MNEIAQEVLKRADVIGAWIGGKVDRTIDFATQQAIDIAMQYVAYGRLFHSLAIVISIAFLITAIMAVRKLLKDLKTRSENVLPGYDNYKPDTPGEFQLFISGIVFVVSLSFSFTIFISNAKDFVMVWAAPKIWLIVQLAELAKVSTK